jgi:penicillin-binding protein 1C
MSIRPSPRRVIKSLGLLALGGGLAGGLALALWVQRLEADLPALSLDRVSSFSPVLRDRNGSVLSVRLSQDGYWRLKTSVEQVDQQYLASLLRFEDRHFYQHPGVNPLSLIRAGFQWIFAGQVVSGGSTITMQVARLLEPKPRTIRNKVIEIIRARQLESMLSKQQILELYLSMVPMGGNLEGIAAASYGYFGRAPYRLSRAEISVLLALPQAPESRRPDLHPDRLQSAALAIARRLYPEEGGTPGFEQEMRGVVADLSRKSFPQLAWQVAQEQLKDADVQTTLDLNLQKPVEAKLQSEQQGAPEGVNLAALVANGQTGEILVYAPSAGLGAPAGYVDLVRAKRSPGSTLKPLIYGLAIDEKLLDDQTVLTDRPTSFAGYAPANFDRGHIGSVRAGRALQLSLNVPAVEALRRVGPAYFYERLSSLGINADLPGDAKPTLAIALGSIGLSLQDLVQAYTVLANGGEAKRLHLTKGQDLTFRRFVSMDTAKTITQILASAPTAEGRLLGLRAAAKTGTSYGYRDAWAVGVKGPYVIGVWYGRPDGTPIAGISGRTHALPILLQIADLLPNAGRYAEWNPEPLDSPGLAGDIVFPRDGMTLHLVQAASPKRYVVPKFGFGLGRQARAWLNGEPIAVKTLREKGIPVPVDGQYDLIVRLDPETFETKQVGFFVSSAQ